MLFCYNDLINRKGCAAVKQSVVKIENLVKRYGDLIALDHFSLDIREGEIFGLLGPNGSGKTTTINCLLALLSFDKGDIEIFGKKMTPTSYEIKQEIGIIMQNVAVFDELTVYENIDYFCGLYISDREKRKQYVEEAIQFVGLDEFRKFRPKKLSGGLLRRLNIACGIAHKPKLIILDEPTVAVDPQSRNRILEGIAELNRNGATVIYTSHYMEEVEQLCTRIAIMDRGRKIAEGTTDELKRMICNTETITIEALALTDEIVKTVSELPHVYDTAYDGTKFTVFCSGGKHNLLRILGVLQEHSVSIGRVFSERPTLNDVFLEITGKALRDKGE
ncbi:MAG: ABC transporter ATP-binding protein [Oscillospiraceae bacterium]|nr:ABC transporter ATP-binding protein [Oscillospiraceae bacterium]